MPATTKASRRYTYADYLKWPGDERWELIDGQAYNMTPSPSTVHQKIVGRFYARLERLLSGTPCEPFVAPTDVVLSEYDVVQPDVLVVCEQARVTEANVQGPPEVIVEVLSTHSALRDKREKKALYERFGVKEYLIVDPLGRYVERYYLGEDGTYGKPEIFGPQDTLPLKAIQGIEVPLREIFQAAKPVEKKDNE
ncbi:Uma2 family endonuclease [Desulfofundulus salinus]|uniref:Uma2 family endonuclease n=1 Tax=Desulfofundulus salinus TaxID=2419843 RepID=A0A494WX51_9FIRM|nr:Uma2 family endonuclease [Desulfofundulus salinum]RKO66882.1 Uma2 family endonuclease [Desulfofundulus salinum]